MRLFNTRISPAALAFGAVILVALVLWPELLSDLARSSDFMPHGFCFQWQSDILTLHVVSDAVIWLSYIGISGLLATLIWRFRAVFGQLPLWAGIASGGFIFFCGLTHLMGIIVIWQPLYWLDGGIKALTALASFATCIGGIQFRGQFIQIFTAARQRDQLLAAQQQAVTQLQAALVTRETNLTTLTGEITRQRDERAQAERALKASEERFHRVFVASPSPKLITRADNRRIVDANPAFMALSGYAHAELIGQTTDALELWPAANLTAQTRAQLTLDGQLTNHEIPIRTRDGSIRELLLSVVSVALDDIGCFLTVMFDQTERKRAELALQRSAARLQHLHAIDQAILASRSPLEIAQATIVRIGHLIPSTRVALIMINMEAQTMRPCALQLRGTLEAPPDRQESLALIADMLDQLQHGQVYQIADVAALTTMPALLRGVHAEHLRAFFMTPILAGDELVATLNVGSDTPNAFSPEHIEIVREIADQLSIAIQQTRLREQIEHHAQQLEQRVVVRTAELTAANQELEAFSYSVSHDLRAPLRAIDGFSRILQEDYIAALPDEAQHYFQLVRDNAQQMGQLVDDLLAFSRLSRQPLTTRSVDMVALVRQCLDELRAEQTGRNVAIQLADLPPCLADPALLKQVWFNLLANALKYSRRRDPAQIDIGYRIVGDQTIYSVADNGVGFDMRYSAKLFGVFQRMHRAEDYEGTGVGLAIVQRIIQRHGGRIWAEAAVDHGATFFFTLEGTLG